MRGMPSWLCAIAGSIALWSANGLASAQQTAPNFVIILVDDAGFMDFGGYGGEARTPHIDRIGDSGVRFINYHTSPLCSPSRAMLLTGIDNHRTGIATIREVLTEDQAGQPGYSLSIEPGILTLAERLKPAGYDTFMTGKWHLGDGPGELPDSHGFDRSFVLDASGADNWEQKPYMPYYQTAPWYEDGEPATLPDDFYSSRFIVDKMISYLETRGEPDRPFLSYLAFQAVHIPVQAPRAYTDGYDGVYDAGWDALAEQRWNTAKDLRLIPADAPMPVMPANHMPWDSLPPDEQALMARSMQVHAGMLEAMDAQIGRLMAYLAETGDLENTVFIVTSDNGPEFNDPVHANGMGIWMALNGYDHKLENLGEKGSLAYIGPHWAAATAAPGSYYKFFSSEGGTRVPLIVAGPGITRRGHIDELSYVTDIVPTALGLARRAGTDIPAPAEGSVPVSGTDLGPLLSAPAATAWPEDRIIGMEVSGNAALFRGRYKLRRMTRPHGDASWQLFDVRSDPGETLDLSSARPDLREELVALYEAYAADTGVIALPDDFDILAQTKHNTIAKQLYFYRWQIRGLAAVIVALLVLAAWLAFKPRRT